MFKVWVKAYGEATWATNGLEFDKPEEAITWAKDLMGRWFGAQDSAVISKDFVANGFITDQQVSAGSIWTYNN